MKAQSKTYTSTLSDSGFHVRFDPLTGAHEFVPTTICFAEGEGGDDESKGSAAKFTQADMDSAVKKRLAKEAAKQEKLEATVAKMQAQIDKQGEIEKKLAETQAALEDAGKGDIEKELNATKRQLEQAQTKLKKAGEELAAANETATKANASLQTHVVETAVRAALLENGVLPKAVEQATRLLMLEGAATLVEDKKGRQTVQVTVDDLDLDPTEGAATWLKSNTHFAKATGGGSGARLPNGKGTEEVGDLDKMNTSGLLAAGLAAERE